MKFLLKFYKFFISNILTFSFGNACRFSPTCSEYSHQAFEKYSFGKATYLTIKRVLKCNPFGPSGYDPLK